MNMGNYSSLITPLFDKLFGTLISVPVLEKTMSKREKGIEMFNEVYCNDLPQPPEKGEDGFFDFMLESLFSELWGNDILTIEQRRLLLLGSIAVTR